MGACTVDDGFRDQPEEDEQFSEAFISMFLLCDRLLLVHVMGLKTRRVHGYGLDRYGSGSNMRYPLETHTHATGFAGFLEAPMLVLPRLASRAGGCTATGLCWIKPSAFL